MFSFVPVTWSGRFSGQLGAFSETVAAAVKARNAERKRRWREKLKQNPEQYRLYLDRQQYYMRKHLAKKKQQQ